MVQTVRIIKKEKPDVIHCHSAKGGMIGRIVGFVTNTPVFYTPHAFSFLFAESKKKSWGFLLLEKIARLNSRMLACSESEHELGIKVVGYKQERTFVWNNAIPAILFQDVKQPDGILPNERFIISIGRSSYPKNPLLMVETMKRVYEKQ